MADEDIEEVRRQAAERARQGPAPRRPVDEHTRRKFLYEHGDLTGPLDEEDQGD